MKVTTLALAAVMPGLASLACRSELQAQDGAAPTAYDPTAAALEELKSIKVRTGDWPQFFGWSHRNNTPDAQGLPAEWKVGKYDEATGKFAGSQNILWAAPLGSQTYGNAVVANGKVFVGTNNWYGYVARFPKNVDLGCMLAFDEKTGKFLWQHSSTKLPQGFVNDWQEMGVCSAAYVDGDRMWYVNNRGEVCCLDTEGFHDDENDGPFTAEDSTNKDEADVVWIYDMMGELGVSQHNMASCSVTSVGDLLFVCTSNGVDESHINIPAPNAPSFFAMDRNTANVLWTDKSPGLNILHGQWSSPCYGELAGQAQVIFAGGDGWLYSFDPAGDGAGNARLLWKFDCNPKTALYSVRGRSERNHIIATPVIYDGLVYVAVGEDPEHGEGVGHLWCIDPSKRGDVSSELALDKDGNVLPPRRLQCVDVKAGEKVAPNPNSAAVWHFTGFDVDKSGKVEYEEEMHRSCGTVAIKDDILYIADFSGVFHCLHAKTGEGYWNHDMFSQAWGSPLIADGKVYIGNEQGSLLVFEHSKELNLLGENDMKNSVFSTPIAANNVLYITSKNMLYAIGTAK
jgi:outer membrane protein assembly factor BamB